MRKLGELAFVLLLVGLLAGPALAQAVGDAETADSPVEEAEANQTPLSMAKAMAIVAACLGAALAAAGGGLAIGRIGSACIDSIARQPEAAGSMFAPMVVAAAMVEGGMLFAILVCLLVVVLL